jgi:hypothetical protein
MVAVSLAVRRRISRHSKAQAASFANDHDEARREEKKPKLALSRTERSAYSQTPLMSLSLR